MTFSADALLAAPDLDAGWRRHLAQHWNTLVSAGRNADLPRWQRAVAMLPDVRPSVVELARDTVRIGSAADLRDDQRAALEAGLRELHPWRKGPFDFFGLHIDTEWRSDWKWQRVAPHLSPLAGRRVLDVGCGSGYHLWRMRGDGAAFVLGIEPALLYLAQFAAARRYLPEQPVHLAPLKLEELPPGNGTFDTAFSMGVIYHRRDPLAHLAELKAALRPGGELVLETLTVERGEQLQPGERYAQMRNVFVIPGTALLERWLHAAGFADIRIVDVSATTTQEQRATDWMRFQSLADFLDPADPARTVEGHPAPVRAVAVARRPE
ncbi:MAG: tRNA 5-methoxyuridine(34)/uridine 5-oxyacetic acid(34) synthase CmoB [Pseudomonadota bacterium]